MAQMKVLPHTLPGTLHVQNKGTLDWGWQDLIAYGCQGLVVVIDPRSVQCLQALTHHKANVIKVRWASGRHNSSLTTPYLLRLASIDSTSHCVVWDVSHGTVSAEFSLGNKSLIDAQWLETNDSCRDLLAVMLSPGVMTIWNADTGTKISRFTFTETILSFSFNPFQPENLVLQSTDCFVFVSDFNPSRTPTGGGKKYYLTNGTGTTPPLPGRNKSPPIFHQRLISGEDIKGESVLSLGDCLQICFSRATRHRLFLLYQREIMIIDTEMKQTIGVVLTERNASAFYHIVPCRQRDVLYCLHENGCVSVRMQQPVQLPTSIPTSPVDPHHHTVHYDLHGHSETLRISKSCQIYAGAVSPSSEVQMAVLTSEGRLLLWEVEFQHVGVYGQDSREGTLPVMLTAHPVKGVGLVNIGEEEEGEKEEEERMERTTRLTLSETIAPHWFVPPTGCTSVYGLISIRLILGNLWVGISSTPTALRMCPPLTTKNWLFYAPLVAMGTMNGSLLVYNLHSKVIMKLYSVHSCPVRGIEWINHSSFISYAYSIPNASGNVRNEVAAINIQTGKVSHLSRPDKPAGQLYSTPVDTIKISTHRQYLVIKYKDRPLEFWDLKSFTFLREMVSNPPSFNCVEWTPQSHRTKSSQTKIDYTNNGGGGANLATVDFDVAMGTTDSKMALAKEQLTVMDVTGCMWQIGIEGSKVKVVHGTPIQTYLNNPTCIAWKNEVLAAGDSDGVLFFHDTKQNRNRTVETPRAVVKKLRFAPGKGNSKLFVLYNSRLDIRDSQSDAVISQLKWGAKESEGGMVVEDVDWATSDKPIVITSDGVVRIYDINLQNCQSEFTLAEFKNPVFSPHSMPSMANRRLKVILQHQPWNVEYSLVPSDHDIDETHGTATETDITAFRAQLEHVPEDFVDGLLDPPLGTSERALLTANLYGDQSAVEFWSVALHYLLLEKHRNQNSKYHMYKNAHPRNPVSDIICPDSGASTSIGSSSRSSEDLLGPLESTHIGVDNDRDSLSSPSTSSRSFDFSENNLDEILRDSYLKTLEATPPLDLCWDLLCDRETYQKVQLERVSLHDTMRVTYQHTKKCSDILLLLGQTDRAVQLLLETESFSSDYYNDALKACLAATIRSSGASQSTIKLVATNLIANSKLMEGVQLLCLIDKQQDACRYLQTYGEWEYSVWLAKSTLRDNYCNDVFSKWVDHLASVGVNQKSKAILVLLSLGHFSRVIEILYSMRRFDQAAVFVQCCLELGVLCPGKETTPLIHAVHLEYARYLLRLKFYRGFMHYCNKAGDKGQKLLQEYFKHGNIISNKTPLIDLTSKTPITH